MMCDDGVHALRQDLHKYCKAIIFSDLSILGPLFSSG